LDRAFNGVSVNGSLLGFVHGRGQTWVEIGVRPAQFGGDHDFADQLDDQLAFLLRVGFAPGLLPLCAHRTHPVWETHPFGSTQIRDISQHPASTRRSALGGFHEPIVTNSCHIYNMNLFNHIASGAGAWRASTVLCPRMGSMNLRA